MPEGPEIRRVADRLGRILIDRPLTEVWFAYPELARQAEALSAARVAAVDSWGKALLTTFSDGQVLFSHNQLYGVWKVRRRERPSRSRRILRAKLVTETHAAELFSASDISLWTQETLREQPFIARLGPDLLTHELSPAAVVERLLSKRFRGRGLGGLLLDQQCLAGVGNYLRSEILFYAGLPPGVRPMQLSDEAVERLAGVIIETTLQAYREAGVTNRPAWRRPLQAAGHPRSVWRHAVFGRDGEPCHACCTTVDRQSVASRRLYRCPRCQPDHP
ncbi:endonuclease VIII [Salinicola avicenniae]|uniref:endonuclease VIII n=1 Tax=Salinicola avicenniae TaxID=2916836 RepID=UPI0020745B3A|nr:endonuclease VIII [Salinicola sp. S1-1-8]